MSSIIQSLLSLGMIKSTKKKGKHRMKLSMGDTLRLKKLSGKAKKEFLKELKQKYRAAQ